MSSARVVRRVPFGIGLLLLSLGFAEHVDRRTALAGAPDRDIEALLALLSRDAGASDVVEHPAIDEDVFFGATYHINQSNDPADVNVSALIDGEAFCSGAVELQPNNTFLLSCNDPWQATAGMHTLRWEFDTTDAIVEPNEDNNVVEFNFTVGNVDFVAERAYLRTAAGEGDEVATPSAGQAVFFHLDYQLNGTEDLINTGVFAVLDGDPWCSGFVDLDAGTQGLVYCDNEWVATPGMHTLQWVLDDVNFVTETNENNNIAEVTFTVGEVDEVDLQAVRAFLRADTTGGPDLAIPEPGQQVFLYMEYDATAPVRADVRAFVDDQMQCSGAIDFIVGGNTVFCPVTWPAVAGPHTLRWVIDQPNDIAETDETNNVATLRFGVGQPPLCVGDCNDSLLVSSDELVRGIMIMLGAHDVTDCPAFDGDLNGVVTIDEAVFAIDNAMLGCL